MPEDYREQCLATFPRRALPRSEFSGRWTRLANRIAEDHEAWSVAMARNSDPNRPHLDVHFMW
jgi:hypothetical protein